MAVMDIARGRPEQKRDRIGGLRAVYFIPWDESSATGGIKVTFDTTNSDVIDTFVASGDTVNMFKYDLKGTSNLSQTQTPSRENGNIFVEQTLTLNIKRLTKEMHEDMYKLAASRTIIVVEDYNGDLQFCGLERGMDMDASTIDTGSNYGDLTGYSLVFKGMEDRPANFVEETAIWTAGNTGSLTATEIYSDITINGTSGSATRA